MLALTDFHSMDPVGGLTRIIMTLRVILDQSSCEAPALHLLTVLAPQILLFLSEPRNLTINQHGHPSSFHLLKLHL